MIGRYGTRAAEWLLLGAGVCLLSWYGVERFHAARYQSAAGAAIERQAGPPDASIGTQGVEETRTAFATGTPIGRLEVPRLHLSVVVANGDDDNTLGVAAGHLPDTPWPWQPGNSAIAAHRDSYFRPLRFIRLNDEIRFVAGGDIRRYKVTRTSIVTPEDLSVLRPTSSPTLTLITCYPFFYVGHAPKRFIVQATALDVS